MDTGTGEFPARLACSDRRGDACGRGWVSGSAGTVPAGIPAGCAAIWRNGGSLALAEWWLHLPEPAELASAAFCNGPLGFSAKCAMPLTPPPTTRRQWRPSRHRRRFPCSASGVVGFWYPESCSIGFWTSSSAPSIAAPFTSPLPYRACRFPRRACPERAELRPSSWRKRPFLRAKLGFDRPTVAAPSAAIALLFGVRPRCPGRLLSAFLVSRSTTGAPPQRSAQRSQ